MYKQDTIAALATPPGESGIAIIRVSGPDAERIAAGMFVPRRRSKPLRSHVLYHGTLRDPKSGRVLDDALIAVMRGPRSYTGEDVVEFHCHGGAFVVRQVLGVILSQGARRAEPGEFTKRAFLNGRLDLSQAEAVLDLIQAKTTRGADLALKQAAGELSRHVEQLREELLDVLVQIEAGIDFPEEEIELAARHELGGRVDRLRETLLRLAATYEWGRLFREGARICICGRPNVGKSSLLNALLDQERAIVTAIPGTTRDVLEESINLDGLPVVLWDTAGIRETEDPVEKIGVERSRDHLERADAVLALLDGSAPITPEDHLLFDLIRDRKSLLVVNKVDLPQRIEQPVLEAIAGSAKIQFVSATRRDGIEELKHALRGLVLGSRTEEPDLVVANLRHKAALTRGAEALSEAATGLARMEPPELVAVDLHRARESLEEIVGVIQNEDILERIFSKFCIGK